MADAKLNIKLSVRDDGTANIKKATGEVEKFGRKGTQAAKSISAGWIKVGAALAGAFVTREMFKFFSSAIRLAGETEKAFNRMQSVVRATGNAAGFTAEELAGMADTLQKTTIQSADEVMNLQSVLLTFKKIGGDAFVRTQQAALDLAFVLQTDAKSAALQLGKALEDPATGMTALTRAGITFNDEEKEVIKNLVATNKLLEAQSLILDKVEGQVGGTSAAAINTYAGATKKAGDAWEELQKSVAEVITMNPEVVASINDTTSSINELADSIRNARVEGRFWDWLTGESEGIVPRADSVRMWRDENGRLLSEFRETAAAWPELDLFPGGDPTDVAPVAELVPLVETLANETERAAEAAKNFVDVFPGGDPTGMMIPGQLGETLPGIDVFPGGDPTGMMIPGQLGENIQETLFTNVDLAASAQEWADINAEMLEATQDTTEGVRKAWGGVANTYVSAFSQIASALGEGTAAQKAFGIASIVMDTAIGIMKAFELPFPLNWAQATAIAAMGATQLATIGGSGGGSSPAAGGTGATAIGATSPGAPDTGQQTMETLNSGADRASGPVHITVMAGPRKIAETVIDELYSGARSRGRTIPLARA
jgi:hypothetical protein